jgi:hypothetical protein
LIHRASQISAQQRFASSTVHNPASRDCLFLLLFFVLAVSYLYAGRFRLTPGLPPDALLLADKILFDQNSVTVSDRHDRTRLWASSLPVISPCVQLAALYCQGEQPTLGASKMMVYRLHLYSLINLGQSLIVSLGLFRLLANYIQNE